MAIAASRMRDTMNKKSLIITFLLNPNSCKALNPNSHISLSIPSFISNTKYPCCFRRCFSGTLTDKTILSDQNVGFRDMGHAQFARKNTPIVRLKPPRASPKLVSQVIDVIRSCKGDDYRSKLDSMGTGIKLPMSSIYEVFQVLGCERVPALQFFEWVRDNNGDLRLSADFCSLIVDNCGWIDDYATMTVLMEGFNHEKICLSDKAFGFLPVVGSHKAHLTKSIDSVVDVLNKVGGSCRSSGIFAMIKAISAMGSFEMGRYVIEITEKKLCYYGVLIREECRRGRIEDARALVEEARVVGCEVDSKLYNYVIGSLCKNNKLPEALVLLQEMKEKGVHPDAITFEIFIFHSCKHGQLDLANQILDSLMHMGLVPRLLTHVSLVRGYFDAGKYEEAYEYVRDVEAKQMPATNKMYSLLARLHQRKGNIDLAQRLLAEMMEKGLKPDYSAFRKTVNVLRHIGDRHLARDLQDKFTKFRIK